MSDSRYIRYRPFEIGDYVLYHGQRERVRRVITDLKRTIGVQLARQKEVHIEDVEPLPTAGADTIARYKRCNPSWKPSEAYHMAYTLPLDEYLPHLYKWWAKQGWPLETILRDKLYQTQSDLIKLTASKLPVLAGMYMDKVGTDGWPQLRYGPHNAKAKDKQSLMIYGIVRDLYITNYAGTLRSHPKHKGDYMPEAVRPLLKQLLPAYMQAISNPDRAAHFKRVPFDANSFLMDELRGKIDWVTATVYSPPGALDYLITCGETFSATQIRKYVQGLAALFIALHDTPATFINPEEPCNTPSTSPEPPENDASPPSDASSTSATEQPDTPNSCNASEISTPTSAPEPADDLAPTQPASSPVSMEKPAGSGGSAKRTRTRAKKDELATAA